MEKAIDGLIKELRTDGVSAIENLIKRQEQEQFFVDFKTTYTTDYNTVSSLGDSDRKNLYKAISGFGNSEGGLLIWGVHGRDFATGKKPIKGITNFITFLNSAISRVTIPVHTSVENFAILDGSDEGYVVTIIPKSNHTPHRTIESGNEGQYYMRAGDSFAPMPHSVLAGMFGRRPSPEVQYQYISGPSEIIGGNVKVRFGIQLINIGQGIARDVFLNALILTKPSTADIFMEAPDARFEGTKIMELGFNLIGNDKFKLPPQQRAQPLIIDMILHQGVYECDLALSFLIGCEGGISHSWEIVNTPDDLTRIYEQGMADACHKVSSDFLKVVD